MKKRILSVTLISFLMSSLIAITVLSAKGQELPVKIPREQSYVHGMNIENALDTMNPVVFSATGIVGSDQLVYECLAWVDPILGKFVPSLAENWSWVGDRTFEIKIQPKHTSEKGSQ